MNVKDYLPYLGLALFVGFFWLPGYLIQKQSQGGRYIQAPRIIKLFLGIPHSSHVEIGGAFLQLMGYAFFISSIFLPQKLWMQSLLFIALLGSILRFLAIIVFDLLKKRKS
ncbi:MAG TPA: hypothetical protein PLJ62_13170 [Thermoflexales bacterium]|nr:hypothetical protein [Thermoflexales bacterium]HQW34193.1 hypothetical protein [Thermoflexales bacterium]HQZ20847.1 hypothetical protein [Thermoflexales bacterium]HRA01149.1 hypothetical protein [Thermoflexales bacterium]